MMPTRQPSAAQNVWSMRPLLLLLLSAWAVGCRPPPTTPVQKPLSNDTLQEMRSYIERDVKAGFLSEEQIVSQAVEILSENHQPETLKPHAVKIAAELMKAHAIGQASWPAQTDCDRLDAAFAELELSGIVCRQNFSDCGTCGTAEIGDEMDAVAKKGVKVRGYAFYHMQDTDSAVDGGGLYLSYGAAADGEAPALVVAREIVAMLERQNLHPTWDGKWSKRIFVELDWKRRRKP